MGVSKNKIVRKIATRSRKSLVNMVKEESTWWNSDKDQLDKQIIMSLPRPWGKGGHLDLLWFPVTRM